MLKGLDRKLVTQRSLFRASGLFIMFILCVGVTYGKAAKAELPLNAQAVNFSGVGDNGESAANYTYLIENWERDIKIDAWGGISITDQCMVTNNSNESINIISINLPLNASSINAQDIFGAYGSTSLSTGKYETYMALRIYLRSALGSQNKMSLMVSYNLPSNAYITRSGWQDCVLNVTLSKPSDWYVKEFKFTVSLPEGAEYGASSKTPSLVQKTGLSVTVEYDDANFTQISNPVIVMQYQYFILWAIFRPALWTGVTVAFFGAVFLARRRFSSSATVVATTSLSPGLLKDYVNLYEERRRLISELESMEAQTEKGKLSRRKFRLRKGSIDDHISRLDKDIQQLSNKISAANERHTEQMKQLQKAEEEKETLKANIEKAEARFLRKEITAEAHRKMLDEYERMMERAENTIEETLLRLKEELH